MSTASAATRRRAVAGLAALALLATIVLLAVGWALGRPAPAVVGPPPADLGATAVAIAGGAGDSVRGWFAPGTRGQGAVLLLHGVHGNRLQMLGRARLLHRAGLAVLLVDLQGHGETRGDAITFGARESRDAMAAWRALATLAPGERTGVVGFSLGGAAALLGEGPLPVDACVLEAVYPTITEAASDRLRLRLGAAGATLAPLLVAQLPLWAGVSPSALRPIDAIGRLRAPLLLIAGERDDRTTLDESRRLFDAASAPKALWVVPGAGHEDFQARAPAEYDARVVAFLREHLTAR
jgi:fermentation-respiration switch protein FrsA (DUF1100 family)